MSSSKASKNTKKNPTQSSENVVASVDVPVQEQKKSKKVSSSTVVETKVAVASTSVPESQPVASTSVPEAEQTSGERTKRFFNGLFLLNDGSVVQYGKYIGYKPKAAANKACTKYYKLREHALNQQPKVFKSSKLSSSSSWKEIYDKFLGQPLPSTITFALQEVDNKSKKFYYSGSRSDIDEVKRNERKKKAQDEKKSVFIDYKHENKVRKLKVGENETAFLTLATHGLNDKERDRVVRRRNRLINKTNSTQVSQTTEVVKTTEAVKATEVSQKTKKDSQAVVEETPKTKSTKGKKSTTEQTAEQVVTTVETSSKKTKKPENETVVVKKQTEKTDSKVTKTKKTA
jgi:hypothetical protein